MGFKIRPFRVEATKEKLKSVLRQKATSFRKSSRFKTKTFTFSLIYFLPWEKFLRNRATRTMTLEQKDDTFIQYKHDEKILLVKVKTDTLFLKRCSLKMLSRDQENAVSTKRLRFLVFFLCEPSIISLSNSKSLAFVICIQNKAYNFEPLRRKPTSLPQSNVYKEKKRL